MALTLKQFNELEKDLVEKTTDAGNLGHLNTFFRDIDRINDICSRRDTPNRLENCMIRDAVVITFAKFLGLIDHLYTTNIDTWCVTKDGWDQLGRTEPGWEVKPFMEVLNHCREVKRSVTNWLHGNNENIKENLKKALNRLAGDMLLEFAHDEHYKTCAVYIIFEEMCNNLIDNLWWSHHKPTEQLLYNKFIWSYHTLTLTKYTNFIEQSIRLLLDFKHKEPYAMILVAVLKDKMSNYHHLMEKYVTEYLRYCTTYNEIKSEKGKITLEATFKKMFGFYREDDAPPRNYRVLVRPVDTTLPIMINFEINSEPELEMLLTMAMEIFFNKKLFNNLFSYMRSNLNAFLVKKSMFQTVDMPEIRLLPQQSMFKQSARRSNMTLKGPRLSGSSSLSPLVKRVLNGSKENGFFYSFPVSNTARQFFKKPAPDAGGCGSRRMARRRSTRLRK